MSHQIALELKNLDVKIMKCNQKHMEILPVDKRKSSNPLLEINPVGEVTEVVVMVAGGVDIMEEIVEEGVVLIMEGDTKVQIMHGTLQTSLQSSLYRGILT